MHPRPYWQFYKSSFPFIAVFSVAASLIFGVYWGAFLFATVGPGIGLIGFSVFYAQQYYFYHNLGISKIQLVKSLFIINLLAALPFFAAIWSLSLFFSG